LLSSAIMSQNDGALTATNLGRGDERYAINR